MIAQGDVYSIRVPASTANLGPGFDSIGLALGLYIELKISLANEWEVIPLSSELENFPSDESNYIISVALKVASIYQKELHTCKVWVTSDIPLARGLGSSASAIVAGVELANLIGDLGLTRDEKNRHASLFEGHPDNAGASVYGGLVIGRHCEERTDILSFPLQNIKVIAVIPEYELLTEESRDVLPKHLDFQEAVQASAISNVLVAALLSKNWPLAGQMMMNDKFHHPYRSMLVPHLSRVASIAVKSGAFGTALSGAGPSVISLVSEDRVNNVIKVLTKEFPQCNVIDLEIDNNGSVVSFIGKQKIYKEM
jgi:homoserine kinase